MALLLSARQGRVSGFTSKRIEILEKKAKGTNRKGRIQWVIFIEYISRAVIWQNIK
jgi:hypothetical protein